MGCPYRFTDPTGDLGSTCGFTGTYTFQAGCPKLSVEFIGNGSTVDVVLGTQPAVTFSGTVHSATAATLTSVRIGTGQRFGVSAKATLSGPQRNFFGLSLFATGAPFSLCPQPHGCAAADRCTFGFFQGTMLGEVNPTNPLPGTFLQPVPEHP